MDSDLLQSVESLAKTGLAAWASKDLIAKLLGPSVDYIGGEIASFAQKCNVNISEVFRRAARKLGPMLEEAGHVNPRVLMGVLSEGALADDPVVSEYVAGVLAAARTEDGRDDRGVCLLSLLRQLSAPQMRFHPLVIQQSSSYTMGATFLSLKDRKRRS